MTRWERLEEWLFDHELDEFDSVAVAHGLGVSNADASVFIQSYLDAQRSKASRTLYVLKRTGRTSAARWSVGQRTADARIIAGTLFSDVDTKVKRAFAPDLARLRERNPRAARYVEARLEAVIDHALQILAVSLDSE